MDVRPVGVEGLEAATETIAGAFRRDPVWGPALGTMDGPEVDTRWFWHFYAAGALRYGTLFGSADAGTVSVWIPPGGMEVSEEQDAEVRRLARQTLDPARVTALYELWERFDAHRPHDDPHGYLSLLATRPDRAGHGFGQAHLAVDLERWDAADTPTYLESTNPRNDRRYQRQGFVPIGSFQAVLNDAVITTMWRPVGG